MYKKIQGPSITNGNISLENVKFCFDLREVLKPNTNETLFPIRSQIAVILVVNSKTA